MSSILLSGREVPLDMDTSISTGGNFVIDYGDYANAIAYSKVAPDIKQELLGIWDEHTAHLNQWVVTGKGDYVGAWAKRFSKFYRNATGSKIDPQVVSVISERIAALRVTSETLNISITRQTDWRAGTFGEDEVGSCYWGSYASTRHGIRDNGGGSVQVRTEQGQPIARCWWLPLPIEQGIMVFNAYSVKSYGLSLLKIVRLMSQAYGLEYYSHPDVRMPDSWINGDRVFTLGNPPVKRPIAITWANSSLRQKITTSNVLSLLFGEPVPTPRKHGRYTDSSTGRRVEGEYVEYHGATYPSHRNSIDCYDCGVVLADMDGHSGFTEHKSAHPVLWVRYDSQFVTLICSDCAESSRYTLCDSCGELMHESAQHTVGDETWCQECYDDGAFTCSRCSQSMPHDDRAGATSDGDDICNSCDGDYSTCDKCGYLHRDGTTLENGDWYCSDCCEAYSVFFCDNCNEYYSDRQSSPYEVIEGRSTHTWCSTCHDADAYDCDNCGKSYAGTECPDCTEDEDE